MKALVVILIIMLCWAAEGSDRSERSNEVEPRGKAKYALIIHFFYVVATKLIVLKIVYGALFFVLLSKGWHFLLWFIHYLKKQKHEHYEYIEDHHEYIVDPHFEHSYGHHGHPYGHHDHPYGHFDHDDSSYGSSDYQPYGYDKKSDYKRTRIYDADGSYAVKGQ
ncbi:uncharacterized protein LOC118277813 [Spodoptera frugiperda]|uniref:Uncharacterized protein LOC118277813 n=1 Tax=Spodoptera frugiperda TaxID=7108 RepID=A0A9R0EZB6_SPOFR|nr:uncharacterized protein LOC118277813 [Spodoptera frugiperda]